MLALDRNFLVLFIGFSSLENQLWALNLTFLPTSLAQPLHLPESALGVLTQARNQEP